MARSFSPPRCCQDAASTSAETRIQALGTTDRKEPGLRDWSAAASSGWLDATKRRNSRPILSPAKHLRALVARRDELRLPILRTLHLRVRPPRAASCCISSHRESVLLQARSIQLHRVHCSPAARLSRFSADGPRTRPDPRRAREHWLPAGERRSPCPELPRRVPGAASCPAPDEVQGHRNSRGEECGDTPGRRVTTAVLRRVREHASRDRRGEGDGDQECDGISHGHTDTIRQPVDTDARPCRPPLPGPGERPCERADARFR